MKRLIGDVPKWSLYLHRAARSLPRADVADFPEHKLEDEIFERLFATELEALDGEERDRAFGEWAQKVHDQLGQLAAFQRLAQECRGRADESAMAVEALMAELRFDGADDALRRSARVACGKASAAIEELREAMEGLEHVAFSPRPGVGTSEHGVEGDTTNARSLAARLRDSPQLRELACLAGRFKRIAGAKRRSRVNHGVDERVDVELGDHLPSLLPLELALLVHPSTKRLAMRNLVERSCLQYRLDGLESLGKGPLVVCLDASGSMADGGKSTWATAVTLALLHVAQAEKRPFAVLAFDSNVKSEHIVMPGESLPDAALFVPADGGTDIDRVIDRGLEIIEQHPGALRQADLVLVTDGGSDPARASELRVRGARLGVTTLGVAIDVEPQRLVPWCDHIVAANDMSRIGDTAADALFGR